MYLHLGAEVIAHNRNIIGIFDLDNATVSEETREFLARAQKEGRVENVSENLPKSFILCSEDVPGQEALPRHKRREKYTVYISQLASSTLLRRSENAELE